MTKPRLYFAHPVNTYDTELEEALLTRIDERFWGHEIVNPKGPVHGAGYAAKGMRYFLEDILPGCDACVLLAFRDGRIGAGVYAEAEAMHKRGCPVWEILPSGDFQTWAPDPARRLTVDGTIARIRNPDRSAKAYE